MATGLLSGHALSDVASKGREHQHITSAIGPDYG